MVSRAASDTPLPGTTSPFYNANLTTVEHLTLSRPLWPYGTPILDYINRTELFETDLTTAVSNIPKLGIAAAANLAQIEAASFTADINLSTPQRPGLDTFMNQQVGTLLTQINAAAEKGPSARTQSPHAVQSFTTATYDRQRGRDTWAGGVPTAGISSSPRPSIMYHPRLTRTLRSSAALLHRQHLRLRQIQGEAVAQDRRLPSQLRRCVERG